MNDLSDGKSFNLFAIESLPDNEKAVVIHAFNYGWTRSMWIQASVGLIFFLSMVPLLHVNMHRGETSQEKVVRIAASVDKDKYEEVVEDIEHA